VGSIFCEHTPRRVDLLRVRTAMFCVVSLILVGRKALIVVLLLENTNMKINLNLLLQLYT